MLHVADFFCVITLLVIQTHMVSVHRDFNVHAGVEDVDAICPLMNGKYTQAQIHTIKQTHTPKCTHCTFTHFRNAILSQRSDCVESASSVDSKRHVRNSQIDLVPKQNTRSSM